MSTPNQPADNGSEQAALVICSNGLGYDLDEMTLASHVQRDLGAESIDELELAFQAERVVGRHIALFSAKLFGAVDGSRPSDTAPKSLSDRAEEEFVKGVRIDPPYESAPGTVARLAEIIARERA